MEIHEISLYLKAMSDLYNQDIGVYSKLANEKENTLKQIDKLNREVEINGLKKELLKESSKEARNNAKDVLQEMSTNGLKYIMGEHVSLRIDINEKNLSPEAEFTVVSKYTDDYVVENDPADGDGGGVGDLVSFTNFFAMNYLSSKTNVAPILLDEPTKYISAQLSDPVAKFLYEMSNGFNKQTFMSTHDPYLAKMGDKTFRFSLNHKGKSIVTIE